LQTRGNSANRVRATTKTVAPFGRGTSLALPVYMPGCKIDPDQLGGVRGGQDERQRARAAQAFCKSHGVTQHDLERIMQGGPLKDPVRDSNARQCGSRLLIPSVEDFHAAHRNRR
jgi:hypothetical protein